MFRRGSTTCARRGRAARCRVRSLAPSPRGGAWQWRSHDRTSRSRTAWPWPRARWHARHDRRFYIGKALLDELEDADVSTELLPHGRVLARGLESPGRQIHGGESQQRQAGQLSQGQDFGGVAGLAEAICLRHPVIVENHFGKMRLPHPDDVDLASFEGRLVAVDDDSQKVAPIALPAVAAGHADDVMVTSGSIACCTRNSL